MPSALGPLLYLWVLCRGRPWASRRRSANCMCAALKDSRMSSPSKLSLRHITRLASGLPGSSSVQVVCVLRCKACFSASGVLGCALSAPRNGMCFVIGVRDFPGLWLLIQVVFVPRRGLLQCICSLGVCSASSRKRGGFCGWVCSLSSGDWG